MSKKKVVVVECESCGLFLTDGKDFWSSTDGRVICDNCFFASLDVLSRAFYAKSFVDAKKIIREFDEEFDESFLNIKYV